MASIKAKFKSSTSDNREGTIYYQVILNRRARQLFTQYHIFSDEWDEDKSVVIINPKSDRSVYLQSIRGRIRWDIERLTKIVHRFEEQGQAYSVDDIIDEYGRHQRMCSLLDFMEGVIVKLKQCGKIRTSETYISALCSFRKFLCDAKRQGRLHNDEDLLLHEISSDLMDRYQHWLYAKGVASNTVSFYMRILRATYNRAVDEGLIEDRRPFRHVYTGVDKTVKRALTIQLIRRIKGLDLSRLPKLDYARDMFLLSFMLRGMSFVDMAFLKKSDLAEGCISYRRRKTGQLLRIEWTKEMQQILNKYPPNASGYLIPIIRQHSSDERQVYKNVSSKVNYALRHIAAMVGLEKRLTLYVARHSWASAAKAKGVPLRIISEGMGHDSESTTQIYLASLDDSQVNKANRMILSAI